MQKNKLELPATPTFQQDPRYQQGINQLQGLGNRLTNFDFSGNLSPLADTINLDPEVTKLALQFAKQSLTPAFRDTVTGLRNEAANAGALESSTFTDALSKAGQDLESQFQAITTGASLEDRNRALNNRMSLFGTGLNTIQGATGFAGQNQGQQNQFNLSNYDNQVAKMIAERDPQNGGFMGGLQGAIGGGLAGFTLGGPIGAGVGAVGGGLMGGFGSEGTGGQLLNAGSALKGFGGARPGSTAGALQTTPDPLSYYKVQGSLQNSGGLWGQL